MNIVITGASGIIGLNIVRELSNQAVSITALNRHFSEKLASYPKVKQVLLDINQIDPQQVTTIAKADALIHLAWDHLDSFVSEEHINSTLPQHYNFLSKLIHAGIETIFISGTCLEYGLQEGKLSESSPVYPTTSYARAKNLLHKKIDKLSSRYKFNLIWGRLFYLYGEDQTSSLFGYLKQAIDDNKEAFNMSGGQQIRDYLSISQAAKIISELTLKQRDFGTVNICSGKPIRIEDLVNQWLNRYNWSIKLNLGFYPYPEYEPMEFWGDNSKLKQCLQL